MYIQVAQIATIAAAPASMAQLSTWRSPVPYLFGGLAVMLGFIALALALLACSYLNPSGYHENSDQRDLEADGGEKVALPMVMEEKYFVIMAGQQKPTFLATPITSSSFGSKCTCRTSEEECKEKNVENCKAIEMRIMHGAHEAAPDTRN